MMRIIPILSMLLVSGCATLAERDQLIGLSRQQILSCMEQAETGEASDNWDRLSFTGSEPDAQCPLKTLAGQQPASHSCTVELSMKNDKVVSVSYRDSEGAEIRDASRCSFLVEKCVK